MTLLFGLGNFLFSILLILISLSQLFGYNFDKKILYVRNVGALKLFVLLFALYIGFYSIFAINNPSEGDTSINTVNELTKLW